MSLFLSRTTPFTSSLNLLSLYSFFSPPLIHLFFYTLSFTHLYYLSHLLSNRSLIIHSPSYLLIIHTLSHISLTFTLLLLSLFHSFLAFFFQSAILQIFSPIILSPFHLTLSRLPTSINLSIYLFYFSLSLVLASFLSLFHRSLLPPYFLSHISFTFNSFSSDVSHFSFLSLFYYLSP